MFNGTMMIVKAWKDSFSKLKIGHNALMSIIFHVQLKAVTHSVVDRICLKHFSIYKKGKLT
jgi:hypothetical protein